MRQDWSNCSVSISCIYIYICINSLIIIIIIIVISRWVWIFAATIGFSLIANVLFTYGLELFNYLDEPVMFELYTMSAHYFAIAVTVAVCCLPDFIYQ
jgi:hypothetical protein